MTSLRIFLGLDKPNLVLELPAGHLCCPLQLILSLLDLSAGYPHLGIQHIGVLSQLLLLVFTCSPRLLLELLEALQVSGLDLW